MNGMKKLALAGIVAGVSTLYGCAEVPQKPEVAKAPTAIAAKTGLDLKAVVDLRIKQKTDAELQAEKCATGKATAEGAISGRLDGWENLGLQYEQMGCSDQDKAAINAMIEGAEKADHDATCAQGEINIANDLKSGRASSAKRVDRLMQMVDCDTDEAQRMIDNAIKPFVPANKFLGDDLNRALPAEKNAQ